MRASAFAQWGCNGGATAQVVISVTLSNKGTYLPTFPQAALAAPPAGAPRDRPIALIT